MRCMQHERDSCPHFSTPYLRSVSLTVVTFPDVQLVLHLVHQLLDA
jgi:hypothetical protein